MKKSLNIYKKNIIFFLPSIEGGGVETNFYNYLTNKTIEKKFNVKILTYDEKKLNNRLKKKVINQSLSIGTNIRIFKIIFCFITLLFLPKENIILSFQANIFAIVASKIRGFKCVIRLNTSPEKYIKNYLFKIFFKIFYTHADRLIVNSLHFKNKIKSVFNLNAVYINNLINYKSIIFKSKKKIKLNFFKSYKGIKLVAVGRLVDQKNHILALKALNKIKNKVNIKLVILGSGKMDKILKNYIKKNDLSKNIKIINYNKNPYNIIKNANYLLLTSKFEGMPNILLESGVLEIPIISSNCPTGPFELKKLNSKAVTLFKNNNIQSLTNSLINLKRVKKSDLKKFKKCIIENYSNSKRLVKILKNI